MENNKTSYQKDRERIHSMPIIAYLDLDQDKALIDLPTRRPDFGLMYNEEYIGIEVTEVRPHKCFNIKNLDIVAVNKTLEKIIRMRLDANKVCAYRIEVVPNETIYNDKIDICDKKLIREIDDHLLGIPHTYNYIHSIEVRQSIIPGISNFIPNNEIGIYIDWGGFLETIPLKPVIEAITKKEAIFNDYLKENEKKFDELWLFVTMPHEEHRFSFKGFELPNTFSSQYSRIFVGQLLPPFANCIYCKSTNQ